MTTVQNAISRKQTPSAPSRRKYARVAPDVRAEIERQVRLPEPPAATAIQAALDQDERFAGRVPPLRTIQNIARSAAFVDDSGPWRLEGSTGATAGLVLDVLAEVIERTEGRIRYVTRNEAIWIVRIWRARPEMDPWLVYIVARSFIGNLTPELKSAEHVEGDTAFLAFAPWRKGKDVKAKWDRAFKNMGRLGRQPRWHW